MMPEVKWLRGTQFLASLYRYHKFIIAGEVASDLLCLGERTILLTFYQSDFL